MIVALKLFLSPLLIAAASLIGRKWGPAVSGWFTGFPFISAPISIVLALQNGLDFSANAALGTLGGQACVCMFALVYILTAKNMPWWLSSILALTAFSASTAAWNAVSLSLLPALFILLAIVMLLARFIPAEKVQLTGATHPWWDLPARMVTALVFVAGLTSAARYLGPQLSGILSAFPVFGLILAAFAHAQHGGMAARQLLRGSILGSFGIAGFYVTIAWLLPVTGSLWIYLLAALMAVAANRISLRFITPK